MRDIKAELEAYKSLTAGKKRADFTASDLAGIYDYSCIGGKVDVTRAISHALAIGYVTGYRAGQKRS